MPSLNGFLVLDKPGGITSRRAVDWVQKAFPRGTRIGHAGTLDPLATGVLVIAVGQATRLIEYVQRMAKAYHAVITLGATSNTDDADGTITPMLDVPIPDRAAIERVLHTFIGELDQVPPAYSAAHVEGERAHRLARRGEAVELTPRKVRIDDIQPVQIAGSTVEIIVRCGKGTYIRSLARDLGQVLGCGGYIASLRRTRIGTFGLPGITLDEPLKRDQISLYPLEMGIAELTHVTLPASSLHALSQGRSLPASIVEASTQEEVAAVDAQGKLHAILSWHPQRQLWTPGKVFVSPT